MRDEYRIASQVVKLYEKVGGNIVAGGGVRFPALGPPSTHSLQSGGSGRRLFASRRWWKKTRRRNAPSKLTTFNGRYILQREIFDILSKQNVAARQLNPRDMPTAMLKLAADQSFSATFWRARPMTAAQKGKALFWPMSLSGWAGMISSPTGG